MDAVFHGDEALTRGMLAEIAALVEQRRAAAAAVPRVPRLPRGRGLPAHGRRQAHRQSRRRVPGSVCSAPWRAADARVRGQGGRRLSHHRRVWRLRQECSRDWLVDCGARHLVLTSRSGAATPEAEAFVESLRERGVKVRVARADVGSAKDVATSVRGNPRGRPAAARACSTSRWSSTTRRSPTSRRSACSACSTPKARGAWLLHEATRDAAARLLRDVLVGLEHLRQSPRRAITARPTRSSIRSPIIARRSACPR